VLALILALMTFGKVLSPQYFIWTLPAWALVAAHDRVLAVLGGLTLLLTGIEFPRLYWDILGMHHGPLALLIARNVMLVAAFGFAAWRLWRYPAARDRRHAQHAAARDVRGHAVAAVEAAGCEREGWRRGERWAGTARSCALRALPVERRRRRAPHSG